MILDWPVVGKNAMWGIWAIPWEREAEAFGGPEQGYSICSRELFTFCKTISVVKFGPGKDKGPEYKTSNDHASRTVHHGLSSFTPINS